MKFVIIDGEKMTSKAAAHAHIAEALDFPMYYGKNLDALADCLSEVPRDTAIVIHNAAAARDALGDYADDLFEVFAEISQNGGFLLAVGEPAEGEEII